MGLFWSKTNLSTVAAAMPLVEFSNPQILNRPVRSDEWGIEFYYKFTIIRGLQVTPDVQVYFKPVFGQSATPVAVFTLRSTAFF